MSDAFGAVQVLSTQLELRSTSFDTLLLTCQPHGGGRATLTSSPGHHRDL